MVTVLKNYKIAFFMLAALIIIPLAVNTSDVHDVLIKIMIYAMAGEAWNIITGFTGQTSFGHAAYFAIGAYTTTVLGQYYNITPWAGMFLGGLIAVALASAVNYRLFRLKGHYFAIATLAVCEILKQLFNVWSYVGAGDGMTLTPRPKNKLFWMALDVRNRLPFLYATLFVLVIVFIVCVILERSKFGFYWKAIRESHEVAESIGVNPQNYKLYAMMISAFITAISGTFYAQAYKYIDAPTVLSLDMSMVFVLVTVLGGLGNVYGPMIGAVIYYALELLFRRLTGGGSSGINLIVFGILIVAVTCFQPRGIVGIAQNIGGRLKGKKNDDKVGESL